MRDHDFFSKEDIAYINYHGRRFHYTYKKCIPHLKPGMKCLSVGAGIASIEKMLVEYGVEVTVVDFPAAIDHFAAYYKKLGIRTVRANFVSDTLDLPENHFDFLLFSEIIEHIPMAPYIQLQKIRPLLKPSGVALITTPNMGSILHIGRLLFMRPIMADASLTFGSVSEENQAVHRREYLPVEIEQSWLLAGFRPIAKKFFYYSQKPSLSLAVLLAFGLFIPRFRQGMLLIGRAGDS